MRKTFGELFEEMEERRKQLEEGSIPPDHALELLRQELRRDRGCPDDESLCGLVDGRLKESNFRKWLDVWHHEQIQGCTRCQEDIRDLEEAILPPIKSAKPTTLGEVFKLAAQRHDKRALTYKRDGTWQSISSKEMFGRARAIALGLYSLGVRHGDRVALISENCPEWTFTDAACQLAGVVDVAIPPKRSTSDVRDALIDTAARVLFIRDRAAYARIAEAIEDCVMLESVVCFDEGGADEAGRQEARALTLAAVEARGRALDSKQPTLADELAQQVRPRDLATIIYTSGTTGKKGQPKPVMLTQENLVSNILACCDHFSPMFFGRLLNDRSLVSLPMWHAPGRIALYIHLHQGLPVDCAESEVYAEEQASLTKICENISERHPTVVIGTPNLFKETREGMKKVEGGKLKTSSLARVKASLLAWAVDIGTQWADCQVGHKPVSPILSLRQKIASLIVPRLAMGGRIRLLISVETALPKEIAWFYKGVGLPIVQAYGLTEASPVIAFGAPKDDGIIPDWRSLTNVEVRFSAKGELEVRGPNVMMGYYQKRDLTEEMFTEDGWLRTGDSGEWVNEGSFEFEPHGITNENERLEADIKGLPFVDQVLIVKSTRGKPMNIMMWPMFERLLSDKQLEGVEANTEDKLREDQRIISHLQGKVISLSDWQAHNLHVVLLPPDKKPRTTPSGKIIEDERAKYVA